MASRGRPSKQGTPFDRLIKLQCQKAVASKSSGGIVGKWGSFSSVRPASSASDLKRASSSLNDVSVGAPKPKKFFKSRDVTTPAADDDDEVSFKDAVVSKIVTNPSSKRILKPLETTSTKHILKPLEALPQVQPVPVKSKFFTSKKVASEPVRAMPRRAAAERVTRQDYADSDSDDSVSAMTLSKASTKTLVSKGKPSASLIQHQQQQQQLQRPSRQQHRVPSATIRNSEESEASGESSSEREDEEDTSRKFLMQVGSTTGDLKPKMTSTKFDRPNVETPTESGDDLSNGQFSEPEIEAEPESLPPLKVPPLKLFLKPPPAQKQQKDTTSKVSRRRKVSDVDSEPETFPVFNKRTTRGGRKRSDNSENNDFVERRSTRTRKESNNSDTTEKFFHEKRTRKVSNQSENEFERTRHESSTEKDRNSNYDEVEGRIADDVNDDDDDNDDDDFSMSRHPSRTKNLVPHNVPKPPRSTRSKPLDKIEEEETEVKHSTTDDWRQNVGDGGDEDDKDLQESSSEFAEETAPQSLSEISKPVEVKIEPKSETASEPLRRTYGRMKNSRANAPNLSKPELIMPEVVKPTLYMPEIAKPTLYMPEIVKTETLTSVDLKFVPDPDLSSLTRARTVASDTNVAAEFRKREASSSSQPVQSLLTKPSSSTLPKRSIFKSKSTAPVPIGPNGGNGNKKGLSLYKHKWNSSNEPDDFRSEVIKRALTVGGNGGGPSNPSPFDDDDFGGPGDVAPSDMNFSTSKMVRVTSDVSQELSKEVVSVKCHKAQKEYFTVIKNVKKAHQIQDSGEFQEFNDDVDYILGGLGAKNSLSTRCLSTVTLASKCMEAPFRMHLRAHGTVTQFFAELKDAPQNPSLALCAATVLFVLSQDRLNMDLDRDSLELMLNLLDTDSRIKDALENSGMNKKELEKNKQKVQELCGEMKKKGHAANLSLEDISADHLSMETLLSLTSKRAGEWFKEELRELGGLDHLVNTMSECINFLTVEEISIWTEPLHNKLKKASRVLKVLESVTSENEENCDYLLDFNNGQFLDVVHTLFKFLDDEVPLNSSTDLNDKDSVSQTLRDCLFDVIRVYINLVHDYRHVSKGSKLACSKPDLFDIVLHCLFVLPESLPLEKRFDVLVLTLTFIINLVEHSRENREKLMKSIVPQKTEDLFTTTERLTATEALINLFLQNEENARNEESKTDQILDGVSTDEDKQKKEADEKSNDKQKSREEVIDETVAQLLHKAGRHMEDTLIASYITLIIGYLILDDKENESQIRELLPENNYVIMVTVLKKFFNFMNLTASGTLSSSRGIKATEKILKYLEKIDKKEEPKKQDDDDDNFDDMTLFDVSTEDAIDSTTFAAADDTSFGGMSMSFSDDFGKL